MTHLLRSRILDWLRLHVPPARVKHILGVEQMAIDLAAYYQLDPELAQLAALMHDIRSGCIIDV
jgi:HD superfamily phosphohydrolase YqeK